MELEITVLSHRLFMLLDDGWYIINDVNDTDKILVDIHCVSVRRKNNIEIVYYDDDTDDKTVDVRVFNKDGYLVSDTVTLSYDELKEIYDITAKINNLLKEKLMYGSICLNPKNALYA